MSIIILSGPVGAGKTTVARELIAVTSSRLYYIEGDTFWSFFVKDDDRSRNERFRLIMRSMTAAAVPLAREGYEVILDFSIPPAFLDTARKIVKELPLHYVLLRPTLGVCETRAAKRTTGRTTDYSVYRDFYELFEDGANAICDDAAQPHNLARRIRDGIDAGGFRVP